MTAPVRPCLSYTVGGAVFSRDRVQAAEDLVHVREFLFSHGMIVGTQVTERWRTNLLVPVPAVGAEL